MAESVGEGMTFTGWLLAAGALLAAVLCILAAMASRSTPPPRRPVRLPDHKPEWARTDPFPTVTGAIPMAKEGRHHVDDLGGPTVVIRPRRPAIYRNPG